jgi:SAM-dependent methyltransferase
MREHFDDVAAVYDRLRVGSEEELRQAVAALADAGDLAGRSVLDVGCGTGATLACLAREFGVRGYGVDPSPRMIAVARANVPPGVELTTATAESLPYADGSFERALMSFVVHHVERPRAFAEIFRVLGPRGRLTIKTSDPAAFDTFWQARLFPSYAAIERRRFPSEEALSGELAAAGFAEVTCTGLDVPRRFSRDVALAKLRERAGSTSVLIDPEEYRQGLARAERELPDPVEYNLKLLLVTGTRPD